MAHKSQQQNKFQEGKANLNGVLSPDVSFDSPNMSSSYCLLWQFVESGWSPLLQDSPNRQTEFFIIKLRVARAASLPKPKPTTFTNTPDARTALPGRGSNTAIARSYEGTDRQQCAQCDGRVRVSRVWTSRIHTTRDIGVWPVARKRVEVYIPMIRCVPFGAAQQGLRLVRMFALFLFALHQVFILLPRYRLYWLTKQHSCRTQQSLEISP